MEWYDYVAILLLVIGGINWLLDALKWSIFNWTPAWLTMIIKWAVGISGIYGLV